jgi:hypothetical protein
MDTTAGVSPRQRRLLLGVVALALMMVVSAVSGLNVAIPDLARDTGATQSEVHGSSTPTRWSSPACCWPPAR